MFYPVESLRRGGRFYLCWVADSWPLRFATITHRQLWSQDLRTICDDLMKVVTNESGRPVKRFSLRLSSQLMRGLARIYQKKVNVVLSELCMINANVTKHGNKRYNNTEASEVQRHSRPRLQAAEQAQIVLPEEPENEQRIEEIIQNSGNVVANIQEITLKEATIPEFQLPPNDNFGEENPDQVLQLLGVLGDRTVELMMAPGDPSAQHSGLEAALDITDKSHDRTRLHDRDRQMERISEHEVTMFRKSNGDEIITEGDFEKEIQIPEIPDIEIPEIPILPQEQLPLEPEIIEREVPVTVVQERPAVIPEPVETELEELEEAEPPVKRRRFRKIIIDKKTRLTADFLRSRIYNPKVELRCEDSSDDVIDIGVPCDVYFRRPCHAGAALRSNLGIEMTRLFMRNLGVIHRSPSAERQFQEEIMQNRRRPHSRSMLERIEEVEEPVPNRPQYKIDGSICTENITENVTVPELIVHDLNVSQEIALPREVQQEVDIADMLTQKIDTLSQQDRKRRMIDENVLTPKKQRSMGYISFRENQQDRIREIEMAELIEPNRQFVDKEGDKENVPENMQVIPGIHVMDTTRPSKEAEMSVAAMLQEAGLADIPTNQPEIEPVVSQRRSSKKQGSEGTETPLGSLDRTKVSLGDSEQTTDSKRFLREQWGTEGTMIKLIHAIRARERERITVRSLISKGPLISGCKAMIAARCFFSLLKLKQHGFITVKKDLKTLEIADMELGPKFDGIV